MVEHDGDNKHKDKTMQLGWAKPITLVILAGYWIALAIGTHLPVAKIPDVPTSDKLLHFGAYFGLAVLVHLALYVCQRGIGWVAVVVGLMFYGALDEWLQIPVGRSCELADWFADVAGILTGTAAFKFALRLFMRPAPTSD